MRILAVLFVSACTVGGAPSQTSDESTQEWTIDTRACVSRDLHVWLPFGSAWATVRALDANRCEILIGGETENPMYDGRPSQRCVVSRKHAYSIEIAYGDGGPAYADDPFCTDV